MGAGHSTMMSNQRPRIKYERHSEKRVPSSETTDTCEFCARLAAVNGAKSSVSVGRLNMADEKPSTIGVQTTASQSGQEV
jgi:hypothetical protein